MPPEPTHLLETACAEVARKDRTVLTTIWRSRSHAYLGPTAWGTNLLARLAPLAMAVRRQPLLVQLQNAVVVFQRRFSAEVSS